MAQNNKKPRARYKQPKLEEKESISSRYNIGIPEMSRDASNVNKTVKRPDISIKGTEGNTYDNKANPLNVAKGNAADFLLEDVITKGIQNVQKRVGLTPMKGRDITDKDFNNDQLKAFDALADSLAEQHGITKEKLAKAKDGKITIPVNPYGERQALWQNEANKRKGLNEELSYGGSWTTRATPKIENIEQAKAMNEARKKATASLGKNVSAKAKQDIGDNAVKQYAASQNMGKDTESVFKKMLDPVSSITNILGQFNLTFNSDGTYEISDSYDFNGGNKKSKSGSHTLDAIRDNGFSNPMWTLRRAVNDVAHRDTDKDREKMHTKLKRNFNYLSDDADRIRNYMIDTDKYLRKKGK